MAVTFNLETKEITMALGDTFTFPVKVTGGPFVDGDSVIFVARDACNEAIIRKHFTLSEGKCVVRLAYADTADKKSGLHTWNLRLLHGVDITENNAEIDDGADVLTLWNKPPHLVLVDGGCHV